MSNWNWTPGEPRPPIPMHLSTKEMRADIRSLREALKEIEEFAARKYRQHSLVGLDWEHVKDIASAALAKSG